MSQTDVRPHGPAAAGVEASEVAQTFGVEAAVALSQAEPASRLQTRDAKRLAAQDGAARAMDDGNNVVAFESASWWRMRRSTHTIEKVRQAGVDVITIEGFELGTGRGGGPRMRCPLTRDPGWGG